MTFIPTTLDAFRSSLPGSHVFAAAGPWGDFHRLAVVKTAMIDVLPADAYVVPHPRNAVSDTGIAAQVAEAGAKLGIQRYAESVEGFGHRPQRLGEAHPTEAGGGPEYLINVVQLGTETPGQEDSAIRHSVSSALAVADLIEAHRIAFPVFGEDTGGQVGPEWAARTMLGVLYAYWHKQPHRAPNEVIFAAATKVGYEKSVQVISRNDFEIPKPPIRSRTEPTLRWARRFVAGDGRRLSRAFKNMAMGQTATDSGDDFLVVWSLSERRPEIFDSWALDQLVRLVRDSKVYSSDAMHVLQNLLPRSEGFEGNVRRALAAVGDATNSRRAVRMREKVAEARAVLARENAIAKVLEKADQVFLAVRTELDADVIIGEGFESLFEGVFLGRVELGGKKRFAKFIPATSAGGTSIFRVLMRVFDRADFIEVATLISKAFEGEPYQYIFDDGSRAGQYEADMGNVHFCCVVEGTGFDEQLATLPESLGPLGIQIFFHAAREEAEHGAHFLRSLIKDHGLVLGFFAE